MTAETCPAVLLLHKLPDGSSHLDLLLSTLAQEESPDERCLIALRLADKPDLASVGEIPCERIENHRAHYLDYEGEIAGGRGTVERVGSLEVWWTAHAGNCFEFEVIHGAGIARCVLDNAPVGVRTTLNVVSVSGAGR